MWVPPECHCHLKVPSLLEMRSLTPPAAAGLASQSGMETEMGLGREGRKCWAPSSRKGQLQKPKASLKYFPRFSFLPSPSSQQAAGAARVLLWGLGPSRQARSLCQLPTQFAIDEMKKMPFLQLIQTSFSSPLKAR